MFTAIYRSKLSPLYWLLRILGKDMNPGSDIPEDLFRVTIIPGIGHDAKVLTKTAKHIFCNIGGCDADSVTEGVQRYLQVANSKDCWLRNDIIHECFSMAVTEEEHNEIESYLSGKTVFRFGYSELNDLRGRAEHEAMQILRHRTTEKFTANSLAQLLEDQGIG